MESPAARVKRLTLALEELSTHTTFLLENREYDLVLSRLERSRPLVDEIARTLLQTGVAASLDCDTQERALRILDAQSCQIQQLAARKAEITEQLQEIGSARIRTQQFRAAYSAPSALHSAELLSG